MLIKFLVVALLFYYVARTARNLYRAIANDSRAQGQMPHAHERQQRPRSPQWQGPTPPRTPRELDAEEARWVDL